MRPIGQAASERLQALLLLLRDRYRPRFLAVDLHQQPRIAGSGGAAQCGQHFRAVEREREPRTRAGPVDGAVRCIGVGGCLPLPLAARRPGVKRVGTGVQRREYSCPEPS